MPTLNAPTDRRSTRQRLASLHRHFHGRWSVLTLTLGALVNLGGLLGLGWIALGA